MAIVELTTIILVVLGVLLIWWLFKKGIALLINSVIGFFALFFASFFLPALKINIWSILLTAVGGIFGFAAVIILHLTGIAF